MKHYCVISHTHWDREWYGTQEQFRLRLVDLMDHLLEILETQPSYIFHLDAQIIALEDYLEIRPEAEAACRRFIREGRLLVGPWYVQNDFFLTSGEATVRNLLLGSHMARELGGCDRVGYAPDQFGLISQLPQILRGFGIDNCVFGRGYHGFYIDEDGQLRENLPPSEFTWEGADGTRVLAVCMSFWYNNAQRFSADPDRALALVQWQEDHFRGVAGTPYLLLMNGCDHIEPQADLLPILRQVQTRLPEGDEIYQTSLSHYLDLVRTALEGRDLTVRTGEREEGLDAHSLKDTSSSRIYLKQQNAALQNLLENQLEPLYALLERCGMAGAYPAGQLDYLWKSLLKNHAHDSICGCSKDAVHRHMEDRFAAIAESGEALLQRGMDLLAAHVSRDGLSQDDYLLTVFNPLEAPRSGAVEVTVDILASDGPRGLRILDPQGNETPYVLLSRQRINKRVISPINLPGFLEAERFRIRLTASAPGLGYAVYRICTGRAASCTAPLDRVPAAFVLENDWLRAEVLPTGQVDLLEKAGGRWFRDVLTLEDTADTGHSYVSIPLEGDRPILLSQFRPEIAFVDADRVQTTLRLRYALTLPESYDKGTGARSENTCVCPLDVYLTLGAGDRALRVTLDLENRARDHRLRALIRTGLDTPETEALTPFDLVRHDKWEIDRRICNETRHNAGAVTIRRDGVAMTVLNRGVYGYENRQQDRGVLALTVLRATGRIWPEGEGAPEDDSWLAPENQCLRRVRVELALLPQGGGDPVDAAAAAKAFQNPLLAACAAVDTRKFLGGRPALQDSNLAEFFYQPDPYPGVRLPRQLGGLTLEGPARITAWKKAFDRSGQILRFFVTASEPCRIRLRSTVPLGRVWKTDLQETARIPLAAEDNVLTLEVRPKEIVTLFLE